jgi:hypothetical protein
MPLPGRLAPPRARSEARMDNRRLLQVIARARHSGAETFFVRLTAAPQGIGEEPRVPMRHDLARAKALCTASIEVGELAFGSRFDLTTRLGFRREIARWRRRSCCPG